MATTLTSKGQVTIPKQIRDALSLAPGAAVEFAVNAEGDVVVRKAAVRSAGVVVGRVEKIVFDDKSFQAQVHIAMESRYRFPKDSSLKILTSGLLGEQYLGIEAGAEEAVLAAGDLITTTQSAVVLESLISQFLYSKAAGSAGPKEAD